MRIAAIIGCIAAACGTACNVNDVAPTSDAGKDVTVVDGGADASVEAGTDGGKPTPCVFDNDASRFDDCVMQ